MRLAWKLATWYMILVALGCFASLCYGIISARVSPVWGALDIILFMAAALGGLMGVLKMGQLNRQFLNFSANAARAGALVFIPAIILFVPLATLSHRL